MKAQISILLTVLVVLSLSHLCFGYGVAVVYAPASICMRLDSSVVQTTIESQIAITKTTQYFRNTTNYLSTSYAFPMGEQASATSLRWQVNGEWFTARIAGTSQDTSLPGGTTGPVLLNYLGATPLFFSIPQSIPRDGLLVVELTYVEFLPYSMGTVQYTYLSDYHSLQSTTVAFQQFDIRLHSLRSIDSVWLANVLPSSEIANYGDSAAVTYSARNVVASTNIVVRYILNANQLGLFGYSTLQPDSLVPDSLGRGFFTFIAEPNPDTSNLSIAKVFTLVIDRSGSMSGTKMQQALNTATYIVNNLNTGDRFNIIDFDNVVTRFRSAHIPFNTQNRDSALAYINRLYARGTTNISGALGVAISQFATANDSTANIIIFLTDGQPTTGYVNTTQLVNFIDRQATRARNDISIFCFGIGSDVNRQVLTLTSLHNHGLTQFVDNSDLYAQITTFYQLIRNPVLINPQIEFTPNIVTETYPTVLPNLYRGSQMIVSGRYPAAQQVSISLSGTAFGSPVSYTYPLTLSDESGAENLYLEKVWAKKKIETLLIQYYAHSAASDTALALRALIIQISRAYGVISPFTSFTGGGGGTPVQEKPGQHEAVTPQAFVLLGNYPNPFNSSTDIQIRLNQTYRGLLEIRIYNILGQLVRTIRFDADGIGTYNVKWNGLSDEGKALASGVYLYAIDCKNTIMVGRMNLVR
ncbi:MAG: VWA domain-containing protein [bacterium]|nr:VWA domain-containing protein [bacterium]